MPDLTLPAFLDQRDPAGVYNPAKETVKAMNDALDALEKGARAAGLDVPGDDRARNLHVAIYRFLAEANEPRLVPAEAFGEKA